MHIYPIYPINIHLYIYIGFAYPSHATSKYFHGFVKSDPNLDCNYTFLIDLAPIGILFGAKSIGKV